MKSILRRILFIPKPTITADEALKIARIEYEKYGKEWDPEIVDGLKNWIVINPKYTLGAARIIINQHSGKVVAFSKLPR